MRVAISSAVAVAWALLSANASASSAELRGLTPEMQQKLAHATTFVCDSGTKSFPLARLNDNYCDCEDGSDEPGTAACSHTDARFFCANAGYFAKHLPTSRVNDHICDCCDGSDEYGSGAACPVTCASLMETFVAEKRGLLDVYEEGAAARATLVADAKKLFEQDQQELAKQEAELETLRRSVSQLEKIKEDEELVETKEKMENSKDTKRDMMRALGLYDLTHEQLGFLVLELANTMYNKDEVLRFIKAERDSESESKIEQDEAAWKTREEEREAEVKRLATLREERQKAKDEKAKLRQEAIDRGETPPEEPAETEEELVDPPAEDRPVKKLFDKMTTFSSYEREQAKTARSNYFEASSKFSTTERTVNDLKAALGKAYGDENVLYALRDKCFETSGGQYKYSVCFFGAAKQDYTSLGDMQAYDAAATPNEIYFSGGATCWNGPARSLRVTLECGATPELYGVDEPSTCVYTAKLKTPVACDAGYKTRLLAGDDAGASLKPHVVEIAVDAAL